MPNANDAYRCAVLRVVSSTCVAACLAVLRCGSGQDLDIRIIVINSRLVECACVTFIIILENFNHYLCVLGTSHVHVGCAMHASNNVKHAFRICVLHDSAMPTVHAISNASNAISIALIPLFF